MKLDELRTSLAAHTSDFSVREPIDTTNPVVAGNSCSGKHSKIGIIDYGMGNQQSLCNALIAIGLNPIVSSDPDVLSQSSLLALPGVGSFPHGMNQLQKRGLDEFVCKWSNTGKPLIGICLGMQMLFESSTEFSLTSGLCLLPGQIERLSPVITPSDPNYLPHMGWNTVDKASRHFDSDLPCSFSQYFVHSYALLSGNPDHQLYTSIYGDQLFAACVYSGNIMGFQFHPERSGKMGLLLLQESIAYLLRDA